jgi:hypothetical protein
MFWTRWLQPHTHSPSVKNHFDITSRLRLRLQVGAFPSKVSPKILYVILQYILHVPPFHISSHYCSNNICFRVVQYLFTVFSSGTWTLYESYTSNRLHLSNSNKNNDQRKCSREISLLLVFKEKTQKKYSQKNNENQFINLIFAYFMGSIYIYIYIYIYI